MLITGIYFSPDEDGGGSTTPQTTDEKTGTPDAVNSGITQDDLNKLVGKARTEGKSAAIKGLLEELGLEDADTLKAHVKAAQDAQAANQSALEKAQTQVDTLTQQLETLTATHEQQLATLRLEILEKEVAGKLRDESAAVETLPDAVVLFFANDYQTDVVGEDETIDDGKLDAAVKKFKSEKESYFKSKAPGTLPNGDGNTPPADDKQYRRAVRSQVKRNYG